MKARQLDDRGIRLASEIARARTLEQGLCSDLLAETAPDAVEHALLVVLLCVLEARPAFLGVIDDDASANVRVGTTAENQHRHQN